MSETLQGYPRWRGEFSKTPRFVTIAIQEVRNGYQNQWVRAALLFTLGYGAISLFNLSQIRTRPDAVSKDAVLTLLNALKWPAIAVATLMGAPALLDDARRGTLEIYRSRGVAQWQYLLGKGLAVSGVTFGAMAAGFLIYYAGSFFIVERLPANWAWIWAGALGYALLWALVLTGLALGVSCVAKNARSAIILLFGGTLGLQIVVGEGLFLPLLGQQPSIFEAVTRGDVSKAFSPTSILRAQAEWLLGVDTGYSWPFWWGLIGLAVLVLLGWGLVAWKHPRLRGVK